jgi:hypothetical protein
MRRRGAGKPRGAKLAAFDILDDGHARKSAVPVRPPQGGLFTRDKGDTTA